MKTVNVNDYQAAKSLTSGLGRAISAFVDIDSNKDGKVSNGEWFAAGQAVFTIVLTNFSSAGVGLQQIKNPTPALRQALAEAFQEGFDIQNNEAEFLVEDFVLWANQGVRLVERAIALRKSKNAA